MIFGYTDVSPEGIRPVHIRAINLDAMLAVISDDSEHPILTMVDADCEATEDRTEAVAVIVVTAHGILTAEIGDFLFADNHVLH